MNDEVQLEEAARALSAAESPAQARQVIDVWAPRFHGMLAAKLQPGPRPELKLRYSNVPGRGGFTTRFENSYLVGVGTKGGRERRFTFAHELAHIVLNSGGARSFEADEKEEEDLCDFFARRALVPPSEIRSYMRRQGAPRTLGELERFADRFRISLRLALVALDEFFPAEWPVAFVAAHWRSHPKRSEVFGLRVDASAGDGRFFIPSHCRLSTLGYPALEAWALEGPPGEAGTGVDDEVTLKSAKPGISGWRGQSAWAGKRHTAPASRAQDGERAVICSLRVANLAPVAAQRRRRPVKAFTSRGPVPEIAGQLGLKPGA